MCCIRKVTSNLRPIMLGIVWIVVVLTLIGHPFTDLARAGSDPLGSSQTVLRGDPTSGRPLATCVGIHLGFVLAHAPTISHTLPLTTSLPGLRLSQLSLRLPPLLLPPR